MKISSGATQNSISLLLEAERKCGERKGRGLREREKEEQKYIRMIQKNKQHKRLKYLSRNENTSLPALLACLQSTKTIIQQHLHFRSEKRIS